MGEKSMIERMVVSEPMIESPEHNFIGTQNFTDPRARILLVNTGMPEGKNYLAGNKEKLSDMPLDVEEAWGQIYLGFGVWKIKKSVDFSRQTLREAGSPVDWVLYSMGVHGAGFGDTNLEKNLGVIDKINSLLLVNPHLNNLVSGSIIDEITPLLSKLMERGKKVAVLLSRNDKVVDPVETIKILKGRKELVTKLPIVIRDGEHGISISELRSFWDVMRDPNFTARDLVGR